MLFLCVCLEFYFFGVGVIRLIDFLWLIRINRLVIILVLCFVKLVISINIVFGVGIKLVICEVNCNRIKWMVC